MEEVTQIRVLEAVEEMVVVETVEEIFRVIRLVEAEGVVAEDVETMEIIRYKIKPN